MPFILLSFPTFIPGIIPDKLKSPSCFSILGISPFISILGLDIFISSFGLLISIFWISSFISSPIFLDSIFGIFKPVCGRLLSCFKLISG